MYDLSTSGVTVLHLARVGNGHHLLKHWASNLDVGRALAHIIAVISLCLCTELKKVKVEAVNSRSSHSLC